MGGAQLSARVQPPALAAEPFAVDEMSAGEPPADACAAEPLERLAVELFGGLTVADQGVRIRVDAEPPVAAAGAGALRESLEGAGRMLGHPETARCLDQLDRRPRREHQPVRVLAGPLRRRQRVFVAAVAVVHHRGRPLEERRPHSLPRNLDIPAAECREPHGRVGGKPAARRLCDRRRLVDQRGGSGKVALVQA